MKTWLMVAGLSIFGGLVDAARQYGAMQEKPSLLEWTAKTLADLLIASFAGLLTYWMMAHEGSTTMTNMMCAAVAMAGYLGGKAIDILAVVWQAIVTNGVKK